MTLEYQKTHFETIKMEKIIIIEMKPNDNIFSSLPPEYEPPLQLFPPEYEKEGLNLCFWPWIDPPL